MSITPTQYDLKLLAEVQQLRSQVGRAQFSDECVADLALTRGLHAEIDSLRFQLRLQSEYPATTEPSLLREQCA